MLFNLCIVYQNCGAVTQRVIKGYQIVVYGATSTCKNRASMTRSMIPYFDGPGPWTRFMEGVHGPGIHVLYFPPGYKVASLLQPPGYCGHLFGHGKNAHTFSEKRTLLVWLPVNRANNHSEIPTCIIIYE